MMGTAYATTSSHMFGTKLCVSCLGIIKVLSKKMPSQRPAITYHADVMDHSLPSHMLWLLLDILLSKALATLLELVCFYLQAVVHKNPWNQQFAIAANSTWKQSRRVIKISNKQLWLKKVHQGQLCTIIVNTLIQRVPLPMAVVLDVFYVQINL